jgi:pimeloyl-ACP methyl ester carboxylesterase
MSGLTHRIIETKGIRIHLAEPGAGPLVGLCHGFPESWYSWRHLLPAPAAAGFLAIGPGPSLWRAEKGMEETEDALDTV